MTDIVTGAQLKTTLGGLGLPPSWFAARMNVTMRTVVRWFDGDDVPYKAAAELEKLEGVTLTEMHRLSKKAERLGVLYTYRVDGEYNGNGMPATWHRALSFRVLENLRRQGHDVKVAYK